MRRAILITATAVLVAAQGAGAHTLIQRARLDGDKVVIVHITDGPDIESPFRGCINDVRRKDIEAIQKRPRRHYVDIHSKGFPKGAVRGQLQMDA